MGCGTRWPWERTALQHPVRCERRQQCWTLPMTDDLPGPQRLVPGQVVLMSTTSTQHLGCRACGAEGGLEVMQQGPSLCPPKGLPSGFSTHRVPGNHSPCRTTQGEPQRLPGLQVGVDPVQVTVQKDDHTGSPPLNSPSGASGKGPGMYKIPSGGTVPTESEFRTTPQTRHLITERPVAEGDSLKHPPWGPAGGPKSQVPECCLRPQNQQKVPLSVKATGKQALW